MASMAVAEAANSWLSSSLRNKRKFRADPPPSSGISDPGKSPTLPQSDYEFSADRFETASSSSSSCEMCSGITVGSDHSDGLKLVLGLSAPSATTEDPGSGLDEIRDADWNDPTESQLEELVLSNLDVVFKTAIKKISALGYTEEAATRAVLRPGVCYGSKDAVSNIVDNTLSFLGRSDQYQDRDRDHQFENLEQLERYVLAEMVCVLREIRPFFSIGDAMWCLLVCDMSVSYACALGSETKPSDQSEELAEASPSPRPASGEERERLGIGIGIGNSSKRSVVVHAKRDYMLRQKTHGSKGSSTYSRSAKLSTLLMDKRLKAMADSAKRNQNAAKPVIIPKMEKSEEAETELSLSVSGRDGKDEAIARLAPRVGELRGQAREWTEWAERKVMQAARRLGRERDELRALRREREEAERAGRERAALEEGTVKKLAEMEGALRRAGGQVERAGAAVRRLEAENGALRREMEAARGEAEECAAACREVAGHERRGVIEAHAWEKHKSCLQDELVAEKRALLALLTDLQQAKALQEQSEARWRQEEKANEELASQRESTRKEREEIEASTKSKEECVKVKSEKSLGKYKDDIERLEKEISQLRLKTDSPKIAALRRGIDEKNPTPPEKPPRNRRRRPTPANSGGGVRRERECVMCLSDEMSVVFLPCAHQVVCTNCNELHEKQGMKDCPSCRTGILCRIPVRYARTS